MELSFEKMDNLMLALIFYIAGAVIRTAYGFLAKIATTPTSELQFDVKYWATMIMSIIVSFMGAIGTFALVIPPGINLVAVFLMAFPSGYALNDAANRGINLVQGISAKSASDATNKALEANKAKVAAARMIVTKGGVAFPISRNVVFAIVLLSVILVASTAAVTYAVLSASGQNRLLWTNNRNRRKSYCCRLKPRPNQY